jgi:arylsulfatase A-like enzyme
VGFALVILVAVAIAAWWCFPWLLLHAPGWIGRLRDPIASNQPVTWQAGPAAARPSGERPPNVVVILADDLGWNDLTFAGGGVANGAVPTPRIDSLAREGVRFDAGYVGNATCAPSRAAIMTGRYPTRFGFEFTPAPKALMRMVAHWSEDSPRPPLYFSERERDVPAMEEEGLPAGEITIAELLKGRGYRTLGLGKWHLGETPQSHPNAQGFDEYLGFLPGGAMYLDPDDPNAVNSVQDFDPIDRFLWANLPFAVRKDGGPRFEPDAYMTDYLADEAAKAIAANAQRPFFLYLAFNAPHTPLQATKADYDALPEIQNHTLRVYAAMIRALDRGVGKVLDALRAQGLEENTLVIFTSDNGGANYIGLPEINKSYRGWKMTFFEGGLRAPFLVRWPAKLPKGARVAAPVAHIDVFATAVAAAGAPLPADRVIDGVNLIPYARGEAQGAPHDALYWRSGHYRSLRAGDWKLQVSERPQRSWLFDLAVDPTEQRDLSAENPAKLRELRAALDARDAEMVAPAWPALIEAPIAIDHPLGVPDSPDDEFVYWPN